MCGRYNITDDPATRLLMEILGIDLSPLPLVNIAPTEVVPVVRRAESANEVAWMRWWLVPSWSSGPSQKYAMFNARCESVAQSRAFREPFRSRRCVVPASSFIEWSARSGEKHPYRIRDPHCGLALAGLWDCWGQGGQQVESFAIITCEARADFRDWHHRMPVMLNAKGADEWLNQATGSARLLSLLQAENDRELGVARLGKGINQARNKSAELLDPVEEELLIGANRAR